MVAIPLPKMADEPQEGWLMGGMKAGNALRKQNLENQYYGPMANAEMASKNAYAQWLPAQLMAQAISSPGFSTLQPEQQKNMLDRYHQALNNPPPANNAPPGGGAVNALMDYFGGPKKESQNSFNLSNQGGGYPQNSMVQPNGGSNETVRASDNEVDKIAKEGNGTDTTGQPLEIPKANQNGAPPTGITRLGKQTGYEGGVNPMSITSAEAAGLQASATGEASAQTEQQKVMENTDNAAAKSSVEMLNQIPKLKEARARLGWYEKGYPIGQLPHVTSAAQDFDAAREAIASTIASAIQSGHINPGDREAANAQKVSRDTNDAAFNHIVNYTEGASHRITEKPGFNKALKDGGYSPAQTEAMWQYYNLKKPFYDNKTHKQNDDNINSWDDFYSNPKNVQAAFSPKIQKELGKMDNKVVANDVTQMEVPKGKMHVRNKKTQQEGYIPAGRWEAYRANGYEEI